MHPAADLVVSLFEGLVERARRSLARRWLYPPVMTAVLLLALAAQLLHDLLTGIHA